MNVFRAIRALVERGLLTAAQGQIGLALYGVTCRMAHGLIPASASFIVWRWEFEQTVYEMERTYGEERRDD